MAERTVPMKRSLRETLTGKGEANEAHDNAETISERMSVLFDATITRAVRRRNDRAGSEGKTRSQKR